MEEADEEKVRYLFEVNTFAPLALIQKLVPSMIRRGGGRIVNIVSSAGRVPIPTVGVYGGSKSALAVMTNTMRLELQPKNIDVINIYPGTINDSFERNAMRENNRLGLCPTADCGEEEETITRHIIEAAAGEPGEVWLEKTGRWMALAAIAWPTIVDNRLKHLRNRAVSETSENKPLEYRRWRLLQVESSIACNLRCIMCPWEDERKRSANHGHMSPEVWQALVPHLNEVRSIDFTGGGEPLLQPHLLDWIEQAKNNGCDAGFLTNGMLLDTETSDRLLNIGLNWICFSIDGADRETYEMIRRGSRFDTLCDNISYLCAKRINQLPEVMINFVIMRSNFHQLEKIVHLAKNLGADQVNFKQCDVIRGESGKGHGLFEAEESKQVKQLQKALAKATRLARKMGIRTTAFSFVPEELPVCDQDPRDSLFIRHDGTVSPCINLAIGGPSSFLGTDIVFPHVGYGRLPEDDLLDLWEGDTARFYRSSFSQRVKAHDVSLARADFGHDTIKLKEAFKQAIDAMPPAPKGCRNCHYLYDI
jgi:MoaA/NifB/PqqE/SkfB family radical SAM enzyme